MTLGDFLVSVWRQAMADAQSGVEVGGQHFPVTATRAQALKVVAFTVEGRVVEGIEQNPRTASRWAKMAQEGQRIMQFRIQGRYVGNVCEGKLLRYPAWKALGLPD